MSVKLRGRCRLIEKLSVLSEPLHARRIGARLPQVKCAKSASILSSTRDERILIF